MPKRASSFAPLCFAPLCFAPLCFAPLCFAPLCFAPLCFPLLRTWNVRRSTPGPLSRGEWA